MKRYTSIIVMLLLVACQTNDLVENDKPEIIVDKQDSFITEMQGPEEIINKFKGLDDYVKGSNFKLMSFEFKNQEYKSLKTDKLFKVPQYDVVLKDLNTNLVMTIRINTDLEESFFDVRTNYTSFDESVEEHNIKKAFLVFTKTNEYLFEDMKNHPDYKSNMITFKKFFEENRGKFLDSNSIREGFGDWEYSFSGMLDDAAFINRKVLNQEIETYDTTE